MLYKVYTIQGLDVIATNYKYFTLCNTKKMRNSELWVSVFSFYETYYANQIHIMIPINSIYFTPYYRTSLKKSTYYLHKTSRSRMLGFRRIVATLGRPLVLPFPVLLSFWCPAPFLLAFSVSWLQLPLLPSLVLCSSSMIVSSSERAGRHLDRWMVSELMVASKWEIHFIR